MPAMAQETETPETDNLLKIAGLEPATDGETLYFLRNVGSGFSLSYGGAWGTQAIETQQAHYVVLEGNDDGTVAIANHGGYLASNELWMDRPKTESRWRLVPVEGYTNQYNLVDDYGRLLSSIGDRSGLLVLKGDEGKALQRWIFTTVDDIRTEKMSAATKEHPIDVSSIIRTGAFDYADGWWPTVNTIDLFVEMMPYEYVCWGDDFTNVKKEYPNSGFRDWDPLVYNYCAILNGKKAELDVDYSLALKLPAGTYHFTCEGFYKCLAKVTTQKYKSQYSRGSWSWTSDGQAVSSTVSIEMDAFIKILLNNTELGSIQLPNKSDFEYDNGVVASQIFRDNDSYQQGIDFYLGGESEIEIQIVRGALVDKVETTGDASPGRNKTQTRTTTAYLDAYSYTNGDETVTVGGNQICFDNFCLYYSGVPSAELPTLDVSSPTRISNAEEFSSFCQNYGFNSFEAGLVLLGGVTGVLDFPLYIDSEWSGNLWTLGYNQISEDEYTTQKVEYDSAFAVYSENLTNYNEELQNIYANTDDYVIYKNYINANVAEYQNSLGKTGKAEFVTQLQALGVNANNINSREKYYEAIAKMEEAFALAKVVDAKEQGKSETEKENADDHIDFSGAIFNHTFDFFTPENGVNKPKGWTYVNSNDTQVAFNANSTYNTVGVDGMYLFNTWGFNASGEAFFGGTPISQTVKDLPTGTYLLSALMTSDAGNHLSVYAEDEERIFQVDHDGKIFDDYGVRFEVGTDGNAFLGVAGAKDDGTCTKDANGRWYKCDNFRLEYLPNGVLTLKETAERITNIDDSFHGVKVERSKMSTKNWSTFVVPFSMAAVPTDWEVMEITGAEARPVENSEYEDLNLEFAAVTSIEAGKPYLVRLKAEPTEGTIRTVVSTSTPNVAVKTRTFDNPQITVLGNGFDYTVEFIGSYTQCTIPNSLDADGNETGTDYYFLSGNKFYRSTGNGNVMKGFRGYFKVTQTSNGTNANAKGLRSLAMTRTETDIENVVDNEEVTVVAIYDVNGIRLSETKPGINILRMNNGTTKKVMVK